MSNQWFRLYSRVMTDPAIEFLSFEDQRHFIWQLCLKNDGILDKEYPKTEMLDKVIARKLGLQSEAFDNCKERLIEVDLIDANWQPKKWNDLQFKSDSSKDRVKKYREKQRLSKEKRDCNVTSTVTVTPQDTEQNRTEQKKKRELLTQIMLAWNRFAERTDRSQIIKIADQRLKHLGARIKTDDARRNLDWWQKLLEFAESQVGLGDWFTFDWMVKSEDNLTKLIEGNYAKPFK